MDDCNPVDVTKNEPELKTEIDTHVDASTLISKNVNETFQEKISFGQMVADKVASFGGSWAFILSFSAIMIGWIVINAVMLAENPFDPYPFILLNLVLSMLAAIQAPFIMLSQRRQEEKDRIKNDHNFEVNVQAEREVVLLHRKLDRLHSDLHCKIDDLHGTLNQKIDNIQSKVDNI